MRAVAAAAVVIAACAHAPARPDATLRVDSAPAARIYVDDVLSGVAGSRLEIAAGRHRVEVRSDGYYTAYLEITAAHNQASTVAAPLRKVPPGEPGD